MPNNSKEIVAAEIIAAAVLANNMLQKQKDFENVDNTRTIQAFSDMFRYIRSTVDAVVKQ